MQPVDPRLIPPGLGSRLGPPSPDTCLVARADFARKIREQRRGQRPLKPARTKIREKQGWAGLSNWYTNNILNNNDHQLITLKDTIKIIKTYLINRNQIGHVKFDGGGNPD